MHPTWQIDFFHTYRKGNQSADHAAKGAHVDEVVKSPTLIRKKSRDSST